MSATVKVGITATYDRNHGPIDKLEIHRQDGDRVCIHTVNADGNIIQHMYIDRQEFAAFVASMDIEGLTYEAPVRLPDEPGLYIRKDLLDNLGRASVMRLTQDGVWRYRDSDNRLSADELRLVAAKGFLKISEVETK